MIRRSLAITLLSLAALPLVAQGQISSSGLIDPGAARQLGLERMWFTQLGLNRSRGKVAGLHQHVSTTRTRIVFELFQGGVRHVFSARELEELGRPLRDVAVLAVLDEAPPANTPPGAGVPRAKFRVLTVLKGAPLAAPDLVIELPYVGDSRKGTTFLITGSEVLRATPPELVWWMPLSITPQMQKHLSAPEAFTPGVDRALQDAEQELSRTRLAMARLNSKALPADDQLPQLDSHVVPEITLYAASESGMVHAIDGETGRTLWTAGVGSARHPTLVPGANDEIVAVLNGSQLYVLAAADGAVLWNKMTAGAPGAGPAVSDTLIFLPMLSGAIETFDIGNPKRSAAVFRSFGRAMTQPTLSANSVAWPTDQGNLYVGNAQVPDMRFRVEAQESIDAAPAFLAPDLIFATSLDGYVYCFTEARGTMLWRFTTGEPVSHSPVALGDTVYAITDRANMYAIDIENASEKWLASGIRRYLSGNERRLYCIDSAGNLAVLDAKSGSLVGTLPMTGLDLNFLNTQTDRILIGTRTGMLQSLRETDSYWPVIHFGVIKPKKTAQPKGAKPADAGGPGGAAPVDPFAVPAGEDPFAPAAPKPMPMPAGADPFAAPPAGAPAAEAPAAPAADDPFKSP